MSSNTPPGWPADSDWTARLSDHFATPGFQALTNFVAEERDSQTVYPPVEKTFTAFALTPFDATKVIILGQDPYHGAGQGHGLSFSVEGDIKIPPSLRNIYKELATDLAIKTPTSGNLTAWAKQGVFLLNTVLTVRESEANSHRKQGWEKFTDEVISQFNNHSAGCVFILWGKPAEKKTKLIDDKRHEIIISPHPSPLSASRGFFGSKPFSRTNEALKRLGRSEVDWRI